MHEHLTARDLLGPINLGLTVESLLQELEDVFPEMSPQPKEPHEELMWRGGQRSVVRWIRSRIEMDSRNGIH
jgi:hypothetical protein